MKRLILVRHAKTPRKAGEIVKNYASSHIIPFSGLEWVNKINNAGIDLSASKMITSPVLRCVETANEINKVLKLPIEKVQSLTEFEFGNLSKKWTEMSKTEFESVVKITPVYMKRQAFNFLNYIKKEFCKNDTIIGCSHGTFICYLQWYLKGFKNIHLYDVITSDDVFVDNLDALEITFDNKFNVVNIRHYKA